MEKPEREPTPDDIAEAVLGMISTLKLLDGFPGVPFANNIKKAIRHFDRPALRTSLVDRLYHPERYIR